MHYLGSIFLLSTLSGHGATERERHARAPEQVKEAREQWVQDRQAKIDGIII